MTDRQKQMIEAYIPGDPDPELDFAEYYMTDAADRVIRVRASSIAYSDDDREIRQVFTVGKRPHPVFGGRGECGRNPGWYYLRALYDNNQDCRDDTHWMYDEWERLREIQQKEARND